MRDYQFLRTLLYRDRSTTLDVFVQTGQEGMSQEGKILDEFPSTREAMYDYDCVVAFDPDWQALSAGQVEVLESWVADQGGGLIVVAGPIYAGAAINGWTQNRAMTPIRNLYPVEFPRRLSSAESGVVLLARTLALGIHPRGHGGRFPLAGRFGRRRAPGLGGISRRLQLLSRAQSQTRAQRFMPDFPIPAQPRAASNRCIWPDNFTDPEGFFTWAAAKCGGSAQSTTPTSNNFTPKLIRHVTQGRLLRGSSRGVLLTAGSIFAGQFGGGSGSIDEFRLEPLVAPGVEMQVFAPNGTMQNVTLRPDPYTARNLSRANFPPLKKAHTAWNCPCPKAITNA